MDRQLKINRWLIVNTNYLESDADNKITHCKIELKHATWII